jgi:hypothetical protein
MVSTKAQLLWLEEQQTKKFGKNRGIVFYALFYDNRNLAKLDDGLDESPTLMVGEANFEALRTNRSTDIVTYRADKNYYRACRRVTPVYGSFRKK